MKKSFGIVLKKFPHKSTFLLLDDMQGKITAISTLTTLCTGAALFYVLAPLSSVYRLDYPEMLYVPFSLARQDILFLHHVLELCCFVMQEGDPASAVLALIVTLYCSPDLVRHVAAKKIFLSKLFVVFGFYPEGQQFQQIYFKRLAAESLDTLLAEPIDLKVEKELDDWLSQCIATYPHMRHLKTMHFLTRTRAV
jgi:hypothetical protein